MYFEDRIAPVSQGELDAAHHDHAPAITEAPASKAVTAAKKPAVKKAAAKK
jgi:hypothetical protein